ncbi:MAG TPA: DegT/DnrJ/EryC1/StrS family aminotransferase [Alphaproteobacteria bacterium]|nr:DegT/DnrJ/EryC1/StrS family aminotransferase [Alphaproteobacteria bacterium]
MTDAPIAFIDLAAQRRRLGERLDRAAIRVFDHGGYIMGPEVKELEAQLAAFSGVRHAITCANGTDALGLALMAKGVGPGDAVLVPTFTFAASAEVVAWVGATPVFVDVLPDTFNIDPSSLQRGVAAARDAGLVPRAVIPVDLFGQPADYDAVGAIAAREGLWILADGAQSYGATYRGARVGAIGEIATTSFFPAKPLGCYGDGGAVFTDSDDLAAVMRSLRVHGQGTDKYDNVRIGLNARLDTLQAAILIEKLAIFPEEIEARQRVAERYNDALADVAAVPLVAEGRTSVWAQYTLRIPGGARDAVAGRLKAAGVPTAVYYPRPLHRQTAYAGYPVAGNGLPVADRLAGEVLSLPMHPYLDEGTQDRIVAAVRAALR